MNILILFQMQCSVQSVPYDCVSQPGGMSSSSSASSADLLLAAHSFSPQHVLLRGGVFFVSIHQWCMLLNLTAFLGVSCFLGSAENQCFILELLKICLIKLDFFSFWYISRKITREWHFKVIALQNVIISRFELWNNGFVQSNFFWQVAESSLGLSDICFRPPQTVMWLILWWFLWPLYHVFFSRWH